MSNFENAIEIQGLTKKYDGFVLDHINFCVPKGCVMGFIGQNGAGKSTTIKAVLNAISVDEGEIRIFGKDYIKHEHEIKEDIAAVFDELPFHDNFTAKQISVIMGGIFKNWNKDTFFTYVDRLVCREIRSVENSPKE